MLIVTPRDFPNYRSAILTVGPGPMKLRHLNRLDADIAAVAQLRRRRPWRFTSN